MTGKKTKRNSDTKEKRSWIRRSIGPALIFASGVLFTAVVEPVKELASAGMHRLFFKPNVEFHLQSILLSKASASDICTGKLRFVVANHENIKRTFRFVFLRNSADGDSCPIQAETAFDLAASEFRFDSLRFYAPSLNRLFSEVHTKEEQQWEVGLEITGSRGVKINSTPASAIDRYNYFLLPTDSIFFSPLREGPPFQGVFYRHDSLGNAIRAPGQKGSDNMILYPHDKFTLTFGDPKTKIVRRVIDLSKFGISDTINYVTKLGSELIRVGFDRDYLVQHYAGILIGTKGTISFPAEMIKDMLGGSDMQTMYKYFGEFVDPELFHQKQFIYIGYKVE